MNSKTLQQKYLYQIVALISLILLVSACGGLGIVLLRQQISTSAEQTRQLEQEIAGFDRKIRQIDSRIASVHHPDFLRDRGEALGLGLSRPVHRQVVRLHAGPQLREQHNRLALSGESASDPLFISIDLALMEPLSRSNP